jgi:hypothetical protein
MTVPSPEMEVCAMSCKNSFTNLNFNPSHSSSLKLLLLWYYNSEWSINTPYPKDKNSGGCSRAQRYHAAPEVEGER